jgi:hypothetical protein
MSSLNETQLIQILDQFYTNKDHSYQQFRLLWHDHVVDYDLLLQYLHPANDDILRIKAIIYGLYHVFFKTRVAIFVSLDQYENLFLIRMQLLEANETMAANMLAALLKERAFALVPQPLHDHSMDYPIPETREEDFISQFSESVEAWIQEMS